MEQNLARLDDVANKTFDFVIIGAGVAGCALASRLSEIPHISVALLEAGNPHFDDPLISAPDGWMKQFFKPEYDWAFRTTSQKNVPNSGGTPDSKFFWSRGKGLGGSSGLNFLYWTRPQREEVDAVEKLGNHGWNWDRFHQASKKSETFYPSPHSNDNEFLGLYSSESVGHNGPIPISFTRTVSGAESYFQKSLKAYGVDVLGDGLGGAISGTFKAASCVDPKSGTRGSAATGYLIPALSRGNLKVLTGAYVRRIPTTKDGEEAVATGVEFEYEGQTYTVNAAREVLISASTVKSPHILELSGIGDRAILEPLGIPVQVHLPSVGTNLQDHLVFNGCSFEMSAGHDFVTSETIQLPEIQSKLKNLYGSEAVGSLYVPGSGVTFLPLQIFSDRADELISALERKIAQSADKLPPGLKEQYDVQLEMLKQKNVPDIEILVFPINMRPSGPPKPHVRLLSSIGRPFSRGTIHAGANDPHVQPTIEPNYFSEEIDFEILVECAKFVRKVCGTGPWKAVSEAEILPGPSIDTDEKLREFVKKNLSTTWHSCGTCSMLPKDKGGVVDTRLKVYGTKNIRVVDLSVVPVITAVHTQAYTYSIAEQAVDIIRADHGF